jgi:hypothetical protein
MTEEREDYLTGLIAIVMSGAFFPTLCVIDEETYPTVTNEEITEEEAEEEAIERLAKANTSAL